MKYRADIDGLRAVAVIAVVLFHAKVAGFAGGFVGVDVFFVISGFLITSLISTAQEEKRFSLLHFYDRRVRRIFPALIAVWVGCLVAGTVMLLPTDFATFGKSLVASAAFVSNVFFFWTTDYFAGPAHEKPLLHTWSLSIEEQFYVVWPLLLVFVLARISPVARRVVLAVALVTSLVAAEWQVRDRVEAAFFLPQYRAWELLLGCVLALEMPRLALAPRAASALSWLGVTLIVGSIISLDATSPFPGLNAVAPCVGAALLILAGAEQRPFVNRVIATRPFVAIGLLSYSLYLWHWPALAFATYYFGQPPDGLWTFGLLAVALLLSVLSWRFVETPFRRHGSARRAVIVAALALVLFISGGLVIAFAGEVRWWLPSSAVEVDRASRQFNPLSRSCGILRNANRHHDKCRFGDSEKDGFELVVIGDSHADHWVPAVGVAAARLGVGGRQVTEPGCPPLFGADRIENGRLRKICRPFEAKLERFLDEHPEARVAIVGARWDMYSENVPAPGEEGRTIFLVDEKTKERARAASREVLTRTLDATVRRLLDQGLSVVLVGQIPALPQLKRSCFAGSPSGRHPPECSVPLEPVRERLSFSNELLTSLADKYPRVETFLPSLVLCNDDVCSPALDGQPLYYNDDHLSVHGGRALAKYLLPYIRRALNDPAPAP